MVVLTTHDTAEVERLAERVVLINHRPDCDGRHLTELRTRFGGGWQVYATVLGLDPAASLEPCPRGLEVLRRDGEQIRPWVGRA